ncbi:hypothetical protein PR048_027873 [Dryococelus australis]|uniref:C2H2-type domain-containing protein n=1 Tax=Dryococelus australis TaxID=614101 RepID=A0ABQ9GHR9_9NEOP|nr:hypothetical protein PR048_027873 [Dryococelus australis]
MGKVCTVRTMRLPPESLPKLTELELLEMDEPLQAAGAGWLAFFRLGEMEVLSRARRALQPLWLVGLRTLASVSTFVPNVHHRKPWSGRSSAARGLTFSQGHKMPSSEARSSKIVPNIGRVSSELTASKLLRSSKNFLQNKTLPKAIKDMGEALSGHQFQPTVVMDQKIKLLEKECDTESSTPKTRNMSAKNTQNDNVVTSTLICKVKRSPRFVRKSVISNIKSKYRNSMPVLSAETVSGKYRTSRRKIPRRKTDKNASVLSLTKDQIGARTDMVLPRRSGRTSVLREKINASMAESSTDEKISTVVETDVLNNCKLLPQTLSSTEGNVQCEEKLPDENTDKQVSSNDSVKNMDIKLDKRNKVRKMTDDIIKTKTKVLKVSIIKRDVLKTDVNEIAHKDCSLVCDGDLHPACEESSASQDKMESYVATYKKIPTPRICLSCGKKFKNISILERHLLKCGTVIKSRRRSTRTIQSSVSKTEVTKSKDIDENMPELQKEEPLEVLSVNESSKKCDDIANDIPVLSPVSGVTVSHTVDICNDEKCDDADFEGIRSRRKSKRGQKTVQSSGLVLNTEEHKNSESNSTSVKHGSLRDDKNSILPVVTQNQNVSSSESKNLKKMFYRRINKTNIPNAKDIENCINSTVISSDILQTVSGSPGNAELSKGSSLKSNANHKIDLSVAQTIVKMVTKKKDNLKINKNCVGKTKNFLKGANKKSKKIKEINSEENGFGIAHSDGELKTEIQVERNENMNKNTESISKTMKVKGQVIRKNLGVKQNQNKKVSQVRSSKRLSKVFSDNITEKIAPSCNKSLIQKSEAEIGNGHYRTSELLQVQEETIDKDSALLVECCKGSQNNCICSVMQVPQVSQDESSKILAESNNIKLSPGSREALCVFNNKEVANTCTKGISISPEKLDPKKELNISQNCFPSHVLHSDEDVKKSEIMVKDLLGLENPNVNNEKFKGENGRFCDVSGDVPNILNKLNNDLTNSKTDIQLEFKKAQHLVLRKKCRKVLNSPKFEMTKTVRNTLTPLNKKNSKINKTKHKNNKILCKEKSEDSSKKCTQNPNISDLEIDAAQVSDAVHSKPALKNLIANSHSTIEVKESLLDLGSSGEIKVTRIQDKLSSLQESCETGMSREQCNVLSRESVSSTETQMNTEMKLEGVPSTCVKQKISTISHTGRRKHKFPKIKSNFFPKCKFKKHHNHPKNSLPKLKSFEGNLNVNLLPFEGLESEGGKNIVAIDKNMSTEAEVTTRFLACDDTKKVDATKLHRFSNNSTYILFEMPTENEITKKSFSEPISNISDKKGCDKVCEVAETNCFENGIKCELKVVSDNVISPACRDESLCCINEEYQPGVAVGNVKKESSVTEIITFSESSLDADEDTLPIAKLREINLSRIRNLNRLNRNNRRHIKRNRKRRVKATEINHIEINCSGGYAVSKTKSLSDVCDTESPNCFVKIQEKTVLPVKDGDELCNDNLKSEENFSLVGNRLLRTRRNNSSDKNVLSQFERRESRARSTRWKLSYEEMYTSSDIASEADSQEFDSNQKENKSILRGHYRRRNRRMRNAKPRNNFLHQDKKRRKSLRRLTVLRNQRKAEMRLETKAFRNGKISLTKSSAINGTQEDHCKNVKMTLIENVFNLENCENVSSVKKYPDIVLESATEEETVSEITKTAVINKVFCKKPKKNNLHEMKMKGKNSVVIDLENTESLQAVLNTQHLESSVEQFRALNNKSSPHENLSFIDNNIIMSADCIKIKKIRSCELFKTDSILDGDCRDNAGENETNHYKKVTKLYEMSKTSDGRKAFTSKNMKSKNLRNLFVKRKDAKVMKIKTTQKRKRQKAKDSLKGHSNVLDQVGNTIPKQLIVTTVDGSDHISSIHLENKKMLHHNNTEYCVVGSAEGIRFPDALEKKIESKHDLDILSDTRLVLDKIVELADTTAKDEILSKEKFVCVLSEEEVSLQKAEISLPIIYTALSKEDTALSKEDTALSKEDTSLSDEDTSLSDEDTSLSKYDAALSKDDVVAQDDAVSLSKDDAALSKDVSLSDDGIAAHSGNCIATHSDDCIAARFDDGTASTSGDGSSHSDNGSALSKDEIALSKDEVALPIEATGFPTEATGFPTEATGLPTEATGLPSEATALPLEGIAFSNVDILNRSFYHTKTVENEMVVSLTSPHSLVQLPGREFSLSGVENSCDITEEEATTQTDSLELLNKSIYDNCVQKESELKNLHYCDICKKHFPSSSNLIKHKLSVFHKKNLAPEVSAYNNGATRAQTVANGSNPECSEEHSSMSDPIITEHYHQDGIDAVSVAENSLDVAFSFSDEVPLSIIAKNMSKNVRKQRKHKKLLTKTSSYKKKIKLENNDKNKRKHIQPKNKLHGKFKRKLLVEKESLKLCVTNKLFVTSGHITDMHYNCPSYQSKPSSTLHFIDDSNKVSSNTESESNSVCNNSTYTLACEEMKETNKCTLTTTSKMEPDSNVLSQLVECVKFMNHSDECKDETESVISKSLLHQPLSLAVLASRYLEEDVLDNMENAFIAPLNKINCFRDTAGKKRCLMAFEEIKKNEDDIVSHPQWQPSLKNIFALPPSFRELCFDSVLLSEVETQDNVLESENFTVEPSTLQNPETPLIPHMDSKFLHSNKNYECTEQTSCRELEKNIPLPEIQIPILLKTDIQGPSLNEEPLESDEKKIEKLTWPVFKIEDPKNCEGENVPVELPEDQHTLSLELDLDESLILQESSKTLQNKACPLQPPQLQQTPIFVERKLQPSLLQVTASSSLEDAKHVPGKIEKTDMKLNFLQIYDGPKLFPQELKSEGLLKQSAPQEYIASKEILQTSASQEKVALQKLVLQEENCKLPTAQNFGAGISKLGKTKKAYIPEKLQVQLPLLKIRDVQFLLAHHVDIQKTTYEDSDSQESMLEDSGIKNSRGQQSINVSLALVKSSDVSFSDNQIKLDQPAENKCEGGFNSSQDTEKLSLAVKEYEHNLCISIKTLPELPKVEENNLCAYVTELSQQEITLFDCSASLLEPKNQESPIDDCMSQMSLGKEPGCEQVTDIIDTLPISNVQEKNLHEYGDSMIPSEHGELDDRIETCDHLTSDMLPKPLNSTISVTAESVTEPQDNILLSNNQICTQVCENVITTEKDFRQQNGEKGSPMQSSEETNFPVPECEDGKQLLKYPYSETVSCPISAASNLEEDRLWRNQNNASEQPIANQTQIQILGNNAPWSQERDKCRDSDELPRKQISNGNSVLHDSLCEPVFRGSSHELFGGSQTLNPSGILGDSLCVQKTVVDVSSSSYDISTQASEMSQNPSWSQKCDSGDTVKDNSSVAQLKMEYSSLHRLAEVVIWSQSHTASPVLESALCRRTELGTSLKMSNGVTWPDSSSERNIHETAASEDNVNWPQKEQNINMFQDSSNEQADVHSSLTKISENKVVWSQNNKVCLPVFPECSHECVCPSSLKDSKNKYTWPENQEIRTSVLQNLADEQHEMHPPSLQISKTDAIVSQENENCVSVLQTLSNEQNEIHHPPVNISQNNLVWQHSGKPDCSLNQSSKHETLQPSVENTNNDLTWSQKENIGVAALQALSLAKDRINIMVDDTHMAQPQTSETYKFSPPTKQCNIHQPSYPDHDFNVCLPHHSEIVANDQQEYPLENVSVNPQLQSDSRSLQLHNQTSYTPIQQSPSLENRTLVPEVQSTFEESTTNEYENQFSSLEVNSAQVSLSQQEHMLKKLPLQLLKETEIECSVPQKPEVNAEILKESSINVPLQGENQTQVDPCAKLPNSEVHTASAKECENQLGYQVGNTAWCGSENGNWPNEQIQNSAGWSGQGELNSNTGWSDWVAGNMNWPQQTAPHIYSTAPVPAEGSLGSIIDSVNQILNEENASGVNSSEAAHVASDYNSYGTLPASCVVPRGLEELQRAMGATDEEMLMLQKLGENCCWPLENAEIMDLDGHKQMPEKNNTVQKIKEAEKATVISKPLENCTKKGQLSSQLTTQFTEEEVLSNLALNLYSRMQTTDEEAKIFICLKILIYQHLFPKIESEEDCMRNITRLLLLPKLRNFLQCPKPPTLEELIEQVKETERNYQEQAALDRKQGGKGTEEAKLTSHVPSPTPPDPSALTVRPSLRPASSKVLGLS